MQRKGVENWKGRKLIMRYVQTLGLRSTFVAGSEMILKLIARLLTASVDNH
jgi:hypothetical protein